MNSAPQLDAWRKELYRDFERALAETKLPERPDYESASHLLPVLLLSGVQLGLDSVWDLRAIDRVFGAFFIPKNYRDFGRNVIDQGMNYTQQVGFNLWQLNHFKREFERALKEAFTADTQNFPKEGAILCMLSSLLFPDRLPLLLECSNDH